MLPNINKCQFLFDCTKLQSEKAIHLNRTCSVFFCFVAVVYFCYVLCITSFNQLLYKNRCINKWYFMGFFAQNRGCGTEIFFYWRSATFHLKYLYKNSVQVFRGRKAFLLHDIIVPFVKRTRTIFRKILLIPHPWHFPCGILRSAVKTN